MSAVTIDAELLAKMFLAGAKNLESKKDWINELNVFPVPDGDTGTNMTLTVSSAAKEVAGMGVYSMDKLAKAISSGSLRGARGNSGVILSQLFRGFCKVIKDQQEITVEMLAAASQKAVETAYKAVMKPKEGTILTVARGAADKAQQLLEETPEIGMEEFLTQVVEHADEVLSQTPEMLPVLKEAGVVDSGGQGLMQILKGALNAYLGIEIDYETEAEEEADELKYLYCTDFILIPGEHVGEAELNEMAAYLETIGDESGVILEGKLVRVHAHTNNPGLIMEKALFLGQIKSVHVRNMKEEAEEECHQAEEMSQAQAQKKQEERKETGFISVSVGEGIGNIFRDLGVDYLIEGGQTMNPSTEDVLNAIDAVNADTVFVFPNNKNIILAANQAQSLVEDKKVIVIPTKTIPQGITALVNYVPENTAEENEAAMCEEMTRVKTGQITYAVRDTCIDEKEIHEGDIMGVGDSGILAVGKEIKDTAIETVKAMADDETELISIYFGADVTEEDAQELCDAITELYPNCDVELNAGGQPIYYYVISAE